MGIFFQKILLYGEGREYNENMKSKKPNRRKNKLRSEAMEIFGDGIQSFGKFLIFALVSLIIFAIVIPMSGGRAIPYFGFAYLLACYFLFSRKSSIIKKSIFVATALIMLALAVSLLGK